MHARARKDFFLETLGMQNTHGDESLGASLLRLVADLEVDDDEADDDALSPHLDLDYLSHAPLAAHRFLP
jgi:hypothetical protein